MPICHPRSGNERTENGVRAGCPSLVRGRVDKKADRGSARVADEAAWQEGRKEGRKEGREGGKEREGQEGERGAKPFSRTGLHLTTGVWGGSEWDGCSLGHI